MPTSLSESPRLWALVSQFSAVSEPGPLHVPAPQRGHLGPGAGHCRCRGDEHVGRQDAGPSRLEHGKQVFLLRELVTTQPWAHKYLDRGAVEVAHVDDVLTRLRTPKQIEELTAGRRQLTLELA